MPLQDEIGEVLAPLLKTFDEKIEADIAGHLTTIYVSGSAEMVSYGKTKMGVPIQFEGPPISQAVDWAEKRSAELVTEMDIETKRRLGKTISDGIKNKRGVPGLARDIRKTFDNMSKYRSELIAKTETRNALFQASHDRMIDMGITGKEWVLGAGGIEGNCPQCQANAAVGIIPVENEFPNPEGSIHPGCTCAIAPARLGK
uniref:Putative portal protein n=1 Tax=viral metagenome TaxID=1070528 RepID=A0A6M3KAJ6_9ZZZZ